jgi:hypothetical protein
MKDKPAQSGLFNDAASQCFPAHRLYLAAAVSCTNPHFPRRGSPDTTMNAPSNVDLGRPPQCSVTQMIIGCVVLAILISGGTSIIADYMLNLIGPR